MNPPKKPAKKPHVHKHHIFPKDCALVVFSFLTTTESCLIRPVSRFFRNVAKVLPTVHLPSVWDGNPQYEKGFSADEVDHILSSFSNPRCLRLLVQGQPEIPKLVESLQRFRSLRRLTFRTVDRSYYNSNLDVSVFNCLRRLQYLCVPRFSEFGALALPDLTNLELDECARMRFPVADRSVMETTKNCPSLRSFTITLRGLVSPLFESDSLRTLKLSSEHYFAPNIENPSIIAPNLRDLSISFRVQCRDLSSRMVLTNLQYLRIFGRLNQVTYILRHAKQLKYAYISTFDISCDRKVLISHQNLLELHWESLYSGLRLNTPKLRSLHLLNIGGDLILQEAKRLEKLWISQSVHVELDDLVDIISRCPKLKNVSFESGLANHFPNLSVGQLPRELKAILNFDEENRKVFLLP